jgi:hypothetical protein
MGCFLRQNTILEVLPGPEEPPIRCAEVFKRLGIDRPTRSQRASLSRALSRLADKHLVAAWCLEEQKGAIAFLWNRT